MKELAVSDQHSDFSCQCGKISDVRAATTASSLRVSWAAGIVSLAAAGIVVFGSCLTWLRGGTSCGTVRAIHVRADLWQLAVPIRSGWYDSIDLAPSTLRIDLCSILGGTAILLLVGVNELGLHVLRWVDRWRWAPPMAGALLILVGDSAVNAPVDPICYVNLSTGPGKAVCVAGAAFGVIASIAIVTSMGLRRREGEPEMTETEDLSRHAV